ncbi:MAG: hypothetical protein AAF280_02135 [Pseudomonadota bacterium]
MKTFNKFLHEEDAAISVDWIVLTAWIVGLAAIAGIVALDGIQSLGTEVSSNMSDTEV